MHKGEKPNAGFNVQCAHAVHVVSFPGFIRTQSNDTVHV